jgi:hypothetical protein
LFYHNLEHLKTRRPNLEAPLLLDQTFEFIGEPEGEAERKNLSDRLKVVLID